MKWWLRPKTTPTPAVPVRKSNEERAAKAPMHLRIPILVMLKDRSELTPAKWTELRKLSRQKGHAPLVLVYEHRAAEGD